MTTEMGNKEFGLWRELPDNIETAWGCRAIHKDKHHSFLARLKRNGRYVHDYKTERIIVVDMPFDRQSCYGTPTNRQALLRILNKGGEKNSAFAKAFKEAERLTKKYEMVGSVDKTFVLFQKDGITILGNTRASYGYLNVIAWVDNHVLEAEVKRENKRIENERKKKQRELNRKKRELRAMFLDGSSLTRVTVESPIYGTTPEIAKAQYGITPDVIFLRSDNWSLGAPMQFAEESDELWPGNWVGFVTKNDNVKYVSPCGTRDLIAEIEEENNG